MGYTTEFEGAMELEPALTPEQTEQINLFCEDRHGGDTQVYAGFPAFWCDWETNGRKLYWNGSEKSYSMDKWLTLLIERFFKPWGVMVRGKMLAQGESRDDRWTMEVGEDQVVKVVDLHLEDLGITY